MLIDAKKAVTKLHVVLSYLFGTEQKVTAFFELVFASSFLIPVNAKVFLLSILSLAIKLLSPRPIINSNEFHYSSYFFPIFLVGFFDFLDF